MGLEKLQPVCIWVVNVFTNFQAMAKSLGALGKKTHPMAEGVGTSTPCLPTVTLSDFSLAALKQNPKATTQDSPADK